MNWKMAVAIAAGAGIGGIVGTLFGETGMGIGFGIGIGLAGYLAIGNKA